MLRNAYQGAISQEFPEKVKFLKLFKKYVGASLVVQSVKNLPAMPVTRVQSLGQEGPLAKGILTPVFLSGEFHGQRSLAGYSPWGLQESVMTEQLTLYLLYNYNEI